MWNYIRQFPHRQNRDWTGKPVQILAVLYLYYLHQFIPWQIAMELNGRGSISEHNDAIAETIVASVPTNQY